MDIKIIQIKASYKYISFIKKKLLISKSHFIASNVKNINQ